MEFSVRLMEKWDIDQAVSIIGSHVEEDGICAADYYPKYFAHRQAEGKRECNYVAVGGDGQIIGVCGFGPDKYGTGGVLWLTWFYVAKAHMGSLVGFRLFETVVLAVRDLGVRKLYLDTSNYQAYDHAVRFYRRAGFALEGQLKDYYGQGEDMVIMGLDLIA